MSWLKRRIHDEVLIHTKDDRTLRGVVYAVGRDGVVLCSASYLEDQATVPLAGEVFIPRSEVAFV